MGGKQKWPQSGHSMSRVGIFLGFSFDTVSSKAVMEGGDFLKVAWAQASRQRLGYRIRAEKVMWPQGLCFLRLSFSDGSSSFSPCLLKFLFSLIHSANS